MDGIDATVGDVQRHILVLKILQIGSVCAVSSVSLSTDQVVLSCQLKVPLNVFPSLNMLKRA